MYVKNLTGLVEGLASVVVVTTKPCTCRVIGTFGTRYEFRTSMVSRSLEFIPTFGESYHVEVDVEDKYITEVVHRMYADKKNLQPVNLGIVDKVQACCVHKYAKHSNSVTLSIGSDSMATLQLPVKAIVDIDSNQSLRISYGDVSLETAKALVVLDGLDVLNIITGSMATQITLSTYEPYSI